VRIRSAVLSLFLAPLLGAFRQTASNTPKITGTVKDPSQAILVGVQVVLTNLQTKTKLTSATDSQGIYVFSGL